ncbi:MAG: helix-turn-helix domain-containing protein [Tepidisphaeraceae bacterium]|jgi:DNA-binding transcriptional regulator YiaG
MPNVNAVLSQQITRLSKRVVNASTKVTRKLVAQHRHDLAALKRQIASLTKRLALVEKNQPKKVIATPEVLEKARFRAIGVKAHRMKLGLSARDYGRLVGVSEVTIYQWERGKSKPRQGQKAKWLAIRGLGKREALQRLGLAEPKAALAAKSTPRQRQRGTFKHTAEEMILSLLKGRKGLTTTELAAAWKKAGRGGAVDNALSQMVKAGKLKRTRLKDERGSRYSLA